MISLSEQGLYNFFNKNLSNFLQNQLNIDCAICGTNIISGYDYKNNRLLITKKDYELIDIENYKGVYNPDKIDYNINEKVIINNELKIIDNIKYEVLPNVDFNEFEDNEVITTKNFRLTSINTDNGGYLYKLSPSEVRYIPNSNFVGTDSINIILDNNKCNEVDNILINVIDSSTEINNFPFTFNKNTNTVAGYTYYANCTINEWGNANSLYFSVKKDNTYYIDKEHYSRFKFIGFIPIEILPTPIVKKYFLFDSMEDLFVDNFKLILTGFKSNEENKDDLIFDDFELKHLNEIGVIYSDFISKELKEFKNNDFYKNWLVYNIDNDCVLNINNSTTIPHTVNIKYNNILLYSKTYNTWDDIRNEVSQLNITYISGINNIELEIISNSWYNSNENFNELINISLFL